jgi:hypothetical protein
MVVDFDQMSAAKDERHSREWTPPTSRFGVVVFVSLAILAGLLALLCFRNHRSGLEERVPANLSRSPVTAEPSEPSLERPRAQDGP